MLFGKINRLKGKLSAVFGNAAGVGSIISAHNVCHWLCLAAVAALSVFGIAVSSTALMFLEDYNLLFWGMGLAFLAVSLFLYSKNPKCISKKLILFNVGLLVIGTPFVAQFSSFFWLTGGLIVAMTSGFYFKEKFFAGEKE